jgi:diaminopimelate epimerase
MRFVKMHGLGNDYVYLDAIADPGLAAPAAVAQRPELARRLADRHTGVGSDGLIVVERGGQAPARMVMFNADGTPSAMCGNGLRCVAKLVADRGHLGPDAVEFTIESGAGLHPVRVERGADGLVARVTLDMGEPRLRNAEIPTTLGPPDARTVDAPFTVDGASVQLTTVSMGNPHAVVFVPDEKTAPVHALGAAIERHAVFPERTNVEFVRLESPTRLVQRTWERGSGETQACGSGACAVLVAAVLTGRADRRATIELLGGPLEIEWREADNRVMMTGPAVEVFTGELTGFLAGPGLTPASP